MIVIVYWEGILLSTNSLKHTKLKICNVLLV